jgi:hypothetical protein
MADNETYTPDLGIDNSPALTGADTAPPMLPIDQQSPLNGQPYSPGPLGNTGTYAPTAPDISGAPAGVPAQAPNLGATPQPSRPGPTLWQSVLQGALAGLAGAQGAKHFGSGLAGGAAGYIQEQQRQTDNAARQQQLQMESTRAADSHILAMKSAQSADLANENTQLALQDHADKIQEQFEEAGGVGIAPALKITGRTSSEMHAQANGALQTLAGPNGGTIPAVATTNNPAGVNDGTHEINVYTVTPNDVQTNQRSVIALVNQKRAVLGQPLLQTQSDIQIAGGQAHPGNWKLGLADLGKDAQSFFTDIPALSKGKSSNEIAAENASTTAKLQQQLDRYKQSPNADPKVVASLQSQLNVFNSSSDYQRQKAVGGEASNITAKAPAEADAAQQKAIADQNTPQGRATLAKTIQETIDAKYKNLESHQKDLFETGQDPQTGERLNLANAPDEMLIDSTTHKPIPTKMLATMKPSQQESNRADFANSALHSLDIIDNLKAQGKLPNGPISGWTTKGLIKAGLSDKDAAEAYGLIALAQSAATGAHVGGRFSAQIMDKMNGLLTLNANDAQFAGQEQALRDVMGPYAQHGGKETVGQYKQSLIGSIKYLPNGQKVRITGLDKNGQAIAVPTN